MSQTQMDLKGRGVFLTGGAQGFGRGMTEALLKKGAKVLFCDVEEDMGKATEAELQKQYGADNVAFVKCDVTDADQLKAAFQAAVQKFGAVEICANNAGILHETHWEKMLAVNTIAQIRGCEIAFEHMRRDKGGRGGVIINTSSVAAIMRAYWTPVYNASKHAILGYTTSRAVDPEMPALGVRWCCLCPGPVKTRMTDYASQGPRGVKNYHKIQEFCKPMMLKLEDVTKAFIYQLEDVENNGKILVVHHTRGPVYRQRILVDEDGVSNPMPVDTPLTQHPPVPGPIQ